MVWCETIIAYDASINAETDSLEIFPGSAPLTTRTGRGKPKITHAMFWASTNDINRVYIVPQGVNDANGIPISCSNVYAATASQSLANSKLDTPIEVPENCQLTIYATSETAANTVVVAWIVLEYPSTGRFVPIRNGPLVRRAWEHGAALVSLTEANSTAITSMLPGRSYQLQGIDGVGVDGYTAGIVGPAFMRITNVELDGAIYWIPLLNGGSFVATGQGAKTCDLAAADMKFPVFVGGTPLYSAGLGYTAEQPQAELKFNVDRIFG
jgi:hypothetical protein